MSLLKLGRNRHFHVLLQLHPCKCNIPSLRNPNSHEFAHFGRSFSSSAAPIESDSVEDALQGSKKPLSVFFKEAISVSGATNREVQEQSVGKYTVLSGKLKMLEGEIRSLNEARKLGVENSTDSVETDKNRNSLWTLFADEKKKKEIKSVGMRNYGIENPSHYRILSTEMQSFSRLLFRKGYLKDLNAMKDESFDPTQLEGSYARGFLKFAAVKFGGDHKEIAKWLSASELKEVVLFGCPSLGLRTVFAAKRIRNFFEIEERKVCQECSLRALCRRKNKVPENGDRLRLSDVTRILVTYDMDIVRPKLVVPERIKNHVSHLLKEIINLCETAP